MRRLYPVDQSWKYAEALKVIMKAALMPWDASAPPARQLSAAEPDEPVSIAPEAVCGRPGGLGRPVVPEIDKRDEKVASSPGGRAELRLPVALMGYRPIIFEAAASRRLVVPYAEYRLPGRFAGGRSTRQAAGSYCNSPITPSAPS
jgi:hypothetical protein